MFKGLNVSRSYLTMKLTVRLEVRRIEFDLRKRTRQLLLKCKHTLHECKINGDSGSIYIRHSVAFYLEDRNEIFLKHTLSRSKLKVDLRSRRV